MAIRVDYNGNVGNCLFQYTFARLLAEKNGLELTTPFHYQPLLKTTPHQKGEKRLTPGIILEEPSFSSTIIRPIPASPTPVVQREMLAFYQSLEQPLPPALYILKGYFECSDLYNKEREKIKSFFILDNEAINENDIVINIRLGDFAKGGFILDPQWYLNILEKESFDRLYIVGAHKNEPYLKAFSRYDPVIIPPDPVTDFHTIRRFKKIICSNSTFCWWAAFLSEATTIYISDRWLSPLLTSCNHSICIAAASLDTYKPVTVYQNPAFFQSLSAQLEILLKKFVVYSKEEIALLTQRFLELLSFFLAENFTTREYTVHIAIRHVESFELHFHRAGYRVTRNTGQEPDLSFTFFDWRACVNFFIFYQQDADSLQNNRYITCNGKNVPVEFSGIKPAPEQCVSLYQYISHLTLTGSYLQYNISTNVRDDIKELLEAGKVIWLLPSIQPDTPATAITCIFREDRISINKKNQLFNQLKFEQFQELNNQVIEATSREYTIESLERALRIFVVLPVDYLVIDRYIIKNHICNA